VVGKIGIKKSHFLAKTGCKGAEIRAAHPIPEPKTACKIGKIGGKQGFSRKTSCGRSRQ